MRGATAELVEAAAQALIQATAQPVQGALLTTLGIFAEPLLSAERFIRLVTKERLMTSDLISYLLQDKVEEFAQEKTALETKLRQMLQQMVEDTVVARFPSATVLLIRQLRHVDDLTKLQNLHRAVLAASDLAEVEQHIEAALTDQDP